uniref:Uncharacterized protein n=1 Tax=Laticauda laticaudata TaxID=8630 RepID=A0A8C5SAE2_LATLA
MSLESIRRTLSWTVPERGGSPPSSAVSTKVWWLCSSRSRGFCTTSSGNLVPSPRALTSRAKRP